MANMMAGSPKSRGRRDNENDDDNNCEHESQRSFNDQSETDGYVSSSVASSFDYRALTEEEKQRILGGVGDPGQKGGMPMMGRINMAAVKEKTAQGDGADFQDDFLAKYDEFSESWRQACD